VDTEGKQTPLSTLPSCRRCAHLHQEHECWEMPHITWWECSKRPGFTNLPSFPFFHTKCKSFLLSEETLDRTNG
jgi:hypothetical protein